jgi:hypothetical protein
VNIQQKHRKFTFERLNLPRNQMMVSDTGENLPLALPKTGGHNPASKNPSDESLVSPKF